jgi:hypothetical protein
MGKPELRRLRTYRWRITKFISEKFGVRMQTRFVIRDQ